MTVSLAVQWISSSPIMEKPVLRTVLSYTLLLVVVLWLVLSYVPDSLVALPALSLGGEQIGSLFQQALLFGLVIFVALQAWLLRSSVRMFRPSEQGEESQAQRFGLNASVEFVWTFIPLVMTLGLALLSHQTWLSLVSP